MRRFIIVNLLLLVVGSLYLWAAANVSTISQSSKTNTTITFSISNPDPAKTDSLILVCSTDPNDSSGGGSEFILADTATSGSATGLIPNTTYYAILRADSTGSDAKTYSNRDTTTTYQVMNNDRYPISKRPYVRPLYRWDSWFPSSLYKDSLYVAGTGVDSTLYFEVEPLTGVHFHTTQDGDSISVNAVAWGGSIDADNNFMVARIDSTTISSTITEWTIPFPVSCTFGYLVLTGGATNGYNTTIKASLRTDDLIRR